MHLRGDFLRDRHGPLSLGHARHMWPRIGRHTWRASVRGPSTSKRTSFLRGRFANAEDTIEMSRVDEVVVVVVRS